MSAPATSPISTPTTHASRRSTSSPAARCRPASRRPRSTASSTGTAASFPTRRCNGCSKAGRGVDTLAFQVDLWSARGELPRNLAEAEVRQKEIQFSEPHAGGDRPVQEGAEAARRASPTSSRSFPTKLRDDPDVKMLARESRRESLQHRPPDLPRKKLRRHRPRTSNSRAGPWRSTGPPATTMSLAHAQPSRSDGASRQTRRRSHLRLGRDDREIAAACRSIFNPAREARR